MWIWDIHKPVQVSRLNNNLIIKQPDTITGELFYSLLGTNNLLATFSTLSHYFSENGVVETLKFIPEETVNIISSQSSLYSFEEDEDNYDYIYDVHALFEAKGSQYSGYRSQLSRFLSKYPHVEVKMVNFADRSIQADLMNLFDIWSYNKGQQDSFELMAFRKFLQYASCFSSIQTLAMYIDSKIIGFAVIEKMTDEYVSLPFFKTNTLYTCSGQFLMSKVVKFLRDTNLKYINFEPDLGIANLRTAKKSYQPIRFFKKYRMKLGEIGSINTVMPLNSLSGGHFSFAQRVRYEFMSTVNLYLDIFKQPSLIFLGLLQLIRDIFYELPRSLFYKKRHESLEQHLEQSASQALTISEIVTIPGNYIGFFLGKLFVGNVYLASIFGANLGDYFSGVLSYGLAYALLSRGHGSFYPTKKAIIDWLEVTKDCFPAALALYISEAPIIAGLIALGFSPDFAIAINLVIAIVIFIGVAKYSANKNIEKRFV